MNKKSQAEIWGVILAIAGAVLAWIMATGMEFGVVKKIITVLLTGIVCYFIVVFIGNQ